ncbi:MAG: phage portal protein [Verrucomicrobia bacterium]|jgi:capsid protein|nr:phage portal protein [Verrucomicrobiota bacterium]MBT7912086.1 phage portal protein [Verrucomicrobiota bacterium]
MPILQYAEHERIPASEIIHPFITDRIAQTRGTPWMVSAMTRLQMLGAYEEAELPHPRWASW